MNIIAMRNELRKGTSDDLERRRKVIGLSVLGLIDAGVLSLFQSGIIKRLPDVPHPFFGANKVPLSKEAFRFGAPDAPMAAILYGITITLATAGGSHATGRSGVFDSLLKGAVGVSAGMGLYYLFAMAANKKLCIYCFTGALINFASAALMFPRLFAKKRKL